MKQSTWNKDIKSMKNEWRWNIKKKRIIIITNMKQFANLIGLTLSRRTFRAWSMPDRYLKHILMCVREWQGAGWVKLQMHDKHYSKSLVSKLVSLGKRQIPLALHLETPFVLCVSLEARKIQPTNQPTSHWVWPRKVAGSVTGQCQPSCEIHINRACQPRRNDY